LVSEQDSEEREKERERIFDDAQVVGEEEVKLIVKPRNGGRGRGQNHGASSG